MMNRRIVVLGGGTAGWMAACLMTRAWPGATITLVESPQIGIVGVGEGSTPQLRALFHDLGIADADWMPRAHATYKVGIEFRGWSEQPGYAYYFHPFVNDVDRHTQPAFHFNALARRRGQDVPAHPDRFFLNSRLAAERLAPLPAANFPFDATYGYHFDAVLVGEVLRDHAVGLGVTHRAATVEEVVVGEGGDVLHLRLQDRTTLPGDLFVDASGFRGVIVQAALGEPFLPFANNLFNDRAVTIATPTAIDGPSVHTTATALSNGWAWAIPLTTRTGNGYVYSSRYLDRDAAEAELRSHLGIGADAAARHLEMKVGRVTRSWVGNCLAIGLAQGFIEPLEATALHLVQATVEGFIHALDDGGGTPANRDAFNAAIARRYEGVRDYIVCHYRLNRRTDTAYWQDNAANDDLSDDLKAMMTAWFTGADTAATVERLGIGGYYAPLSWDCLFAGYGTFPDRRYLQPTPDRVGLDRIYDIIARSARNFPAHASVLAAQGARA